MRVHAAAIVFKDRFGHKGNGLAVALGNVFNDILVPSTFKDKASINLYPIDSIAGGIEYTRVNYSVNCRANDYPSCKSIANNVVDLLNRYNQSGYFLVANIQAVIRPENELDTYNIPIEVIYRSK